MRIQCDFVSHIPLWKKLDNRCSYSPLLSLKFLLTLILLAHVVVLHVVVEKHGRTGLRISSCIRKWIFGRSRMYIGHFRNRTRDRVCATIFTFQALSKSILLPLLLSSCWLNQSVLSIDALSHRCEWIFLLVVLFIQHHPSESLIYPLWPFMEVLVQVSALVPKLVTVKHHDRIEVRMTELEW